MGIQEISGILQDTIWVSLLVSAPILATALGAGLLVSVFQAATQINEQTLTFVPKIVLTLIVFALMFPRIMTTLVEFTERLMAIVSARA